MKEETVNKEPLDDVVDLSGELVGAYAKIRNEVLAEEYKSVHPEQADEITPDMIPEQIDAQFLKDMGNTVDMTKLYEAIKAKRNYALDVDYDTFNRILTTVPDEVVEAETARKNAIETQSARIRQATGKYQARHQERMSHYRGDNSFDDIIDTVHAEFDGTAADMEIEDLNSWGEKSRKKKKGGKFSAAIKEILSWIIPCALAVAIAMLLKTYVIINAHVPSGSMENTIMTDSNLFGCRMAYRSSDPARGDIVIFLNPDDESEKYIKRIIGLPGDHIEINDATVYINGVALEEDYLKEKWIYYADGYVFDVPEDSYFMMGDNRNGSKDARLWEHTYVKRDKILAKAMVVYWPVSEWKVLYDTPEYTVDQVSE